MRLSKDLIDSANQNMRNRSKTEYKPKMRVRASEKPKPSTTTSSTKVAKPSRNTSTRTSAPSKPSLGSAPKKVVEAKKPSPRGKATMAAKAIGLGGLAAKIRRREELINNIK